MWTIGQRVLGKRQEGPYWYPGTVRHVAKQRLLLPFPECGTFLDSINDRYKRSKCRDVCFNPMERDGIELFLLTLFFQAAVSRLTEMLRSSGADMADDAQPAVGRPQYRAVKEFRMITAAYCARDTFEAGPLFAINCKGANDLVTRCRKVGFTPRQGIVNLRHCQLNRIRNGFAQLPSTFEARPRRLRPIRPHLM